GRGGEHAAATPPMRSRSRGLRPAQAATSASAIGPSGCAGLGRSSWRRGSTTRSSSSSGIWPTSGVLPAGTGRVDKARSLLRGGAVGGGDGLGEALGEVLGGTRLGGVEVEIGDRRRRRQLGVELVDLALREVPLAERRPIEAAGRRRQAVVVDADERAQRLELPAREVRAADVVVDPGLV